jgi:hypothetical protein
MQVERIDEYNEKYQMDVNVSELITNLIYQFYGFLKYIEKNHSSILEMYIKVLEAKFRDKIDELGTGVNIFLDYEKSLGLEMVQKYPELFESYRRMIEITLGLSDHEIQTEKAEVKISVYDRFKGVKSPLYLALLSLAETIPRDEAINIYKKMTDERSQPSEDRELQMLKVDEMLDLYRKSFPASHIYSLSKMEDGKAVCRIDRCMIYEVLADFDKDLDTDIAYLTACINDFGHARMVNYNFELTREKTIMELDEYCDFCWHDKSIQKEISHPDQEFWEKLT